MKVETIIWAPAINVPPTKRRSRFQHEEVHAPVFMQCMHLHHTCDSPLEITGACPHKDPLQYCIFLVSVLNRRIVEKTC